GEALGAFVAEVGLRRSHVPPVRSRFRAACFDRNRRTIGYVVSGFDEQLLDDFFRALVFALTEVMVSNSSSRIDEIERRPIMVVEGSPDRILAVDGHGIPDSLFADRAANVDDILLETELPRVHTDHDEPLIGVLRCPRAHVWKRASPIDARVRPELHEHYFAAKIGRAKRP